MKKLFIIILLIGCVGLVQAQLNSMGFPDENLTQTVNFNNTKAGSTISPSTIVSQFAAPVNYIADIAYDGNYIIAEGYNEYQLYFIDPTTGATQYTIPTDVKRPYGLTFFNSSVYILDNENMTINELNPDDGALISTISINDTSTSYPTGMASMNGDLWYNDAIGPYPYLTGDKTKQIASDGSLLSTYDASEGYPSGMTFDGQYLWIADNETQLIHQVDPVTFVIVKTIEAPGGVYPNGLAWDGQYLWVANNDADSIYQIDVGSIATNVTITNNNEIQFNVYPNPASDYVHVTLNVIETEHCNVSFYNLQGALVKTIEDGDLQKGTYNFSWDCISTNGTKIAAGVYLCTVTTGKNRLVSRIMVN